MKSVQREKCEEKNKERKDEDKEEVLSDEKCKGKDEKCVKWSYNISAIQLEILSHRLANNATKS